MKTFPALLALCIAIAICTSARADIAAILSGRDNTLYQDPSGGLSNGAGTGMFAGRNAAANNSIRRGLVWFDIASTIPAGSTITGATLTLYNSAANSGDATVSLHRALELWGEGASVAGGSGGGGGGPAAPGDATWLYRDFPLIVWANPGGTFDPVSSASATVAGTGTYNWSSPVLINDIQLFLDGPSANFGWAILGDESAPSTAKRFATREETAADLRPMLLIEYTPVPAPGAAVALTLFSLATVGSRRRR